MTNIETWKPVPDYEALYEVSDHGRLRRIATHKGNPKESYSAPHRKKDGYIDLWLHCQGHPKRVKSHRLVWEAFIGPIPKGMVINHKNGIKDDNRLANLEVCSVSENTKHGFRVLGRAAPNHPSFGEKNGSAKLNADKVREIRRLRSKGIYQHEIAKMFGVSQRLVSLIDRRKIWAAVD